MRNFFWLILLFSTGAQAQTFVLDYSEGEETHNIEYRQHDTTSGKVIAVYSADTAQVAFVQNYRNGRKFGLYTSFSIKGFAYERGVYAYDERDGEWTFRDSAGAVTIKGKYKAGVKHGYWFDRSTKIGGRYVGGKKHGKWKITYDNGAGCTAWYDHGEFVKSAGCGEIIP
jgi:hypothetical protein